MLKTNIQSTLYNSSQTKENKKMSTNYPRKLVWDGFYKLEVVQTPQGEREIVHATNSVNVLFYNRQERYVLLVRQPRVAMATSENPKGLITETVAGRFDVKIGVKGLIIKEAKEEAGVEIKEEQIEMLNNGQAMALSAGACTEKAYLAICEINASMIEVQERIFGVADEGEEIERIFLSFDDLGTYVCEDLRVFTLLQYLSLSMLADSLNQPLS